MAGAREAKIRRKRRGSDPSKLTTEEIEEAIDQMKVEGTRTELWMSARARRKMDELAERDRAFRDAFEAGYRMGSDGAFLAPLLGLLIGVLAVVLVSLATDRYIIRIPEIPPPLIADTSEN